MFRSDEIICYCDFNTEHLKHEIIQILIRISNRFLNLFVAADQIASVSVSSVAVAEIQMTVTAYYHSVIQQRYKNQSNISQISATYYLAA